MPRKNLDGITGWIGLIVFIMSPMKYYYQKAILLLFFIQLILLIPSNPGLSPK